MVEGEISFGRFRLDLARRELRRDEKPVRLGSRALDILCVLASAGGKLVSKDELMERVWAGVVVEEHNIQVHMTAFPSVAAAASFAAIRRAIRAFLINCEGDC